MSQEVPNRHDFGPVFAVGRPSVSYGLGRHSRRSGLEPVPLPQGGGDIGGQIDRPIHCPLLSSTRSVPCSRSMADQGRLGNYPG
jgi:hypothetical protein